MTRAMPAARPRFEPSDVSSCLFLLLSAWCVILVGRVAEDATGDTFWTAASFAAGACLVVLFPPSHRATARPAAAALGFASGFAGYPGWIVLVWLVGSGLGLSIDEVAATSPTWPLWVASVLFAPVFEEVLYRGHVLSVARGRVGPVAAVVVSSALFAISHVYAWSVVNTFLSGLVLGAVRLGSGSIGLCIALHAGFNVATLVCGLPPERLALGPAWSSAVGSGTLLLAVWAARRGGRGASGWSPGLP